MGEPQIARTTTDAASSDASSRVGAKSSPGKRAAVHGLNAVRLPPGTPPRVPKAIDVTAIDTGGLSGVVRDAWRDKYCAMLSPPAVWEQINAVDGDVGLILADAIASIKASPSHAPEVLHEYWKAIADNWPEVVGITVGLIATELAVATLAAAPDPSMATKLAAIVLQAVIILFIGFGVIVELGEAISHGIRWWDLVRDAEGDPEKIAAAATELCHVALHVLLAALAVAGMRAKLRGPVDKTAPIREADGVSPETFAVKQVEARTGIQIPVQVANATAAERYAMAYQFYRAAGMPEYASNSTF